MALALGTVQLGLPYGHANTTGLPDDAAAGQLLQAAISKYGIRIMDTGLCLRSSFPTLLIPPLNQHAHPPAPGYGLSEARLGECLETLDTKASCTVVTKLEPPSAKDFPMSCSAAVKAHVEASVCVSVRVV